MIVRATTALWFYREYGGNGTCGKGCLIVTEIETVRQGRKREKKMADCDAVI